MLLSVGSVCEADTFLAVNASVFKNDLTTSVIVGNSKHRNKHDSFPTQSRGNGQTNREGQWQRYCWLTDPIRRVR